MLDEKTSLVLRERELNWFYERVNQVKIGGVYEVSEPNQDCFTIMPAQVASQEKFAFIAITHGNEWAGLGVFNQFLQSLLDNVFQLKHAIVLILANKPAYLANERFIDTDLNRLYDFDGTPKNSEERRIGDLRQVLDDYDVCIDFHQTVEPTHSPFFIFPFHPKVYQWARWLMPQMPIITNPLPERAATCSAYMVSKQKMGVTVELGDRGFELYQTTLGYALMLKTLSAASWHNAKPLDVGPIYTLSHHELNRGGHLQFNSDLKHLSYVKKNQEIGTIDNQPLKSKQAGYLLMYPPSMANHAKSPSEGIYVLCNKISARELERWPRLDERLL